MLVGAHQRVPVTFNDTPERYDDSEVLQMIDAAPARGGGRGQHASRTPSHLHAGLLTNAQITAQLYEFLQSRTACSCV